MTDIKVGDWVVEKEGTRIELFEVERKGRDGSLFDTRWRLLNIAHFRIATPAEIAAGHRIDTPPNATISPPRHDLPQDGATVQEGDKDAATSSRGEFEAWCASNGIQTNKHDADGTYVNNKAYYAWKAWQHQQAVVTTLTEALDIKEQLNQKLREREEELQKQALHAARQFNDQRDTVADLEYRNKELQKRVEALELENLDLRVEAGKHALSTFTAPKPAKVGWFACFKKALGADHENS